MLQGRTSGSPRVILHLDVDCFFLAVHRRHDPSLSGPLVLWQYNDVICVSPEAKAAGVRKHMRPSEAQALVHGIAGQMVHAFSRRWPGPRVWYGPYSAASREVFALLRRAATQRLGEGFVLERASIDEAYLDVSSATAGCLLRGAELASHFMEVFKEAGMSVSVGVSRNRLLAKLSSLAAKPPKGKGIAVTEEDEVQQEMPQYLPPGASMQRASELLRSTPAARLPGCGGRADRLAELGLETVSQLQGLGSAAAVEAALGLGAEAAARVAKACRGYDDTPVRAADPKKSLVVTSWFSDTCLGDLAERTEQRREDGKQVQVGNGWLFEPQIGKGISNFTRGRWLLLALVLDLEERVVNEFLDCGQLPTKLTVSYMGPGAEKEPGPGSTDGRSVSRTCAFPTQAFRDVSADDGRAIAPLVIKTPVPPSTPNMHGSYKHQVYGSDFLAVSGSSAAVLSDGPEILQEPRRGARIAALTNTACGLISAWAKELRRTVPIAKLSLAATSMEGPRRGGRNATATHQVSLRDALGLAKRTEVEVIDSD